jgi:hypothetical protein
MGVRQWWRREERPANLLQRIMDAKRDAVRTNPFSDQPNDEPPIVVILNDDTVVEPTTGKGT